MPQVPVGDGGIDASEEIEVDLAEEDDTGMGFGILFFRQWHEDSEKFSMEFLDYLIELDDGGYVDYGEMMKGDLSDMDEIIMMKKVSNFPQAVNNTLFDVWIRPPFYYLAVSVPEREHVQNICGMIKEYFGIDSIYFRYPLT
ncbi:MAG: hypothetical protein ACMUIG_09160 [Thermoplasmatota archaeon]